MTSRQEEVKDAKFRQLQELELEQRDDAEYEEFLRKETERLKLRGFTPRVRNSCCVIYICTENLLEEKLCV